MYSISNLAAVGVGAICGALCRNQIGKTATERIAKDPNLKHLAGWHTAGINIVGSFVLGGVFATPLVDGKSMGAGVKPPVPPMKPAPSMTKSAQNKINSLSAGLTPRMKLLLGVGFCGSFSKSFTWNQKRIVYSPDVHISTQSFVS